MIFYYVRHGDPIYEPDSLTEYGQKQAEALSKRFSLYGLDEVYTSDSVRAQMTAEPTLKRLGLKKTVLDWTNEGFTWNNFTAKDSNGKLQFVFDIKEYKEKFNSKEARALGAEWYKYSDFGGNTFEEGVKKVDEKVDEFFAGLGFVHDRENGCYKRLQKNEKRVALFAHAGFGLVFLSSVLDIPYSILSTHFDLSHSAVTVIWFDEREEKIVPRVLQWCNDSHLYKEELLKGYNNNLNI
ncbi:MAG: histidine phosphatase family protein [Clostridia bacterium]|nr:histidine phosphatase family protein [Clostridia bacterium]